MDLNCVIGFYPSGLRWPSRSCPGKPPWRVYLSLPNRSRPLSFTQRWSRSYQQASESTEGPPAEIEARILNEGTALRAWDLDMNAPKKETGRHRAAMKAGNLLSLVLPRANPRRVPVLIWAWCYWQPPVNESRIGSVEVDMGSWPEPASFQERPPKIMKYCRTCGCETPHEIRRAAGVTVTICVACLARALAHELDRD